METDHSIILRAFEGLVTAAAGNPRALVALAHQARENGDIRRSLQLAEEVLSLGTADPETARAARDLMTRMVPDWHYPMMLDDLRNQAFQDAIERAVRPDMRVLDIGSGSGLLAMMAARAGAGEVHSCELNPVIAQTARDIVERNGFAGTITVHGKNSNKLDPEADLGGRADLVISEIIGKDFVCEHVLPSMRDAARRLAKPGAQFIPQGGEIRVALAHYARLDDRMVGEVCGFDLSPFNNLRHSRINVQVNDPALTLRGSPADLYAFDFDTIEPVAERTSIELEASGGPVNGVIQWLRLQMDADGSFENPPGPDSSRSWAMVFFPFAETVTLAAGDRVQIGASITRNKLRLWKA